MPDRRIIIVCTITKDKLDEILKKPNRLPDSELSDPTNYFNNEWDAVVDIFKRGDTALDNNLVERMNRYFSMSRRSSLFFGSHKGAERAAVLYTLALSARMHHLKFLTTSQTSLTRLPNGNPIHNWKITEIYYQTAGNSPQKN